MENPIVNIDGLRRHLRTAAVRTNGFLTAPPEHLRWKPQVYRRTDVYERFRFNERHGGRNVGKL